MGYFNFGKNWLAFSRHSLDEERLKAAEESLVRLIGEDVIRGRTFLDIGCGSGIFSIAAKRIGAARVVGFDISPESVQAAEENKRTYSGGSDISFYQRTILSGPAEQIGQFDIVYSWGVLHHTGDMWKAIQNAAALVNNNGLLVVALYNKHWSSRFWKWIKYRYNVSPRAVQFCMIYFFAAVIACVKFLATFKNPFRRRRGMSFYYDVIDWVGGYPYEYATPEEVLHFVSNLGFTVVKVFCAPVPTGCNEFIFQK